VLYSGLPLVPFDRVEGPHEKSFGKSMSLARWISGNCLCLLYLSVRRTIKVRLLIYSMQLDTCARKTMWSTDLRSRNGPGISGLEDYGRFRRYPEKNTFAMA
jgi:hypothetical protein